MNLKELKPNPKLIRGFERYLQSETFKNKIAEVRDRLKLPQNGFIVFEQFSAWILKRDTRRYSKFWDRISEVQKRLDIPIFYHDLLSAYVALGENYAEYDFSFTDSIFDFGCSAEYEGDVGIIRIYPQAKSPDVKYFLNKTWRFFPRVFNLMGKNLKTKQIRTRRKETVYKKIYSYYKEGVIRYDGSLNRKKLKEINPNFERLADLDSSLVGLDMDNIKKIIQIQKQRNK